MLPLLIIQPPKEQIEIMAASLQHLIHYHTITWILLEQPNHPQSPAQETLMAAQSHESISINFVKKVDESSGWAIWQQSKHDFEVLSIADHHLIVQSRQKPSLQLTYFLTTHAQYPGVVLDQALDGLVEEDLVCHHCCYTQKPSDLANSRIKVTPLQEFEEEAEGESGEEGRGTVQNFLDELFVQLQSGKNEVLQGDFTIRGPTVLIFAFTTLFIRHDDRYPLELWFICIHFHLYIPLSFIFRPLIEIFCTFNFLKDKTFKMSGDESVHANIFLM